MRRIYKLKPEAVDKGMISAFAFGNLLTTTFELIESKIEGDQESWVMKPVHPTTHADLIILNHQSSPINLSVTPHIFQQPVSKFDESVFEELYANS